MKIIVTPETDAEKRRFKKVTHNDVRDFFILGNKADEENTGIDFHDWNGSYRYLVGSLYFFIKTMENEMHNKANADTDSGSEVKLPPEALGFPMPTTPETPNTPTTPETPTPNNTEINIDATNIPGVGSIDSAALKFATGEKEVDEGEK